MTAQRIDGNALSQQLRADVTRRASALKAKGITPGLAVILVGKDPASQIYVNLKKQACEKVGIEFHEYLLEEKTHTSVKTYY